MVCTLKFVMLKYKMCMNWIELELTCKLLSCFWNLNGIIMVVILELMVYEVKFWNLNGWCKMYMTWMENMYWNRFVNGKFEIYGIVLNVWYEYKVYMNERHIWIALWKMFENWMENALNWMRNKSEWTMWNEPNGIRNVHDQWCQNQR